MAPSPMASIPTFVVFALATFFAVTKGEFTELRLYEHADHQGNYVSFVSKQPDLSAWKFFTGQIQSFDTFPQRYHWFGYDEINYSGAGIRQFLVNSNLTYFATVNSIRYVGAQDASVRAISFYRHTFFRGDEHYSESAAGSGIPFRPTALGITGGATYTLFEGADFNGNATCVEAPEGVGLMGLVDFPVASFVRGCDDVRGQVQIQNRLVLSNVVDESQMSQTIRGKWSD